MALFMSACGGDKFSPEDVVEQCWLRLSQGDVAGAVELFALSTQAERDIYTSLYTSWAERLAEVGGVAEVDILSVSCGEREASVEALVVFANGTENRSLYSLVHTDLGWQIAQ